MGDDLGRRLLGIAHWRAWLTVEAGERRHDALGIADEDAFARLQIRQPAQAFRPFERDQDVDLAFRDGRRPDARAEADVAEHGAAALGHAVHFALLDLVTLR